MPRLIKLAIATFTVLMSTIAVGLVAAEPAYAAGCYAAGCIHKDPQAQGCSSGATSPGSVVPPGGGARVYLRWSAACAANWARFDDNGTSPGYWNYWVETSDGHREDKLFNNASWTYMVNGNLAARACIQGLWTDMYACTAWY